MSPRTKLEVRWIMTPVAPVPAVVGGPVDWLAKDNERLRALVLSAERASMVEVDGGAVGSDIFPSCPWCGYFPHRSPCRAFSAPGIVR